MSALLNWGITGTNDWNLRVIVLKTRPFKFTSMFVYSVRPETFPFDWNIKSLSKGHGENIVNQN